MIKTIILNIFLLGTSFVFSQTLRTIADGEWSNSVNWSNSTFPVDSIDYDSIIVSNKMELDVNLEIINEILVIDSIGEICSNFYSIFFGEQSSLINNGLISVGSISAYGPNTTLFNNGDIYTKEFFISPKEVTLTDSGNVVIDSIFQNSCTNNSLSLRSDAYDIINVYPNPFNETLTIQWNITQSWSVMETKSLFIYDVLGKEVLKQQIPNQVRNGDVTLDVSQLQKGIYVLDVEGIGRIKIMKH